MSEHEHVTIELLDERLEFTLRQVCTICRTPEATVVDIVREGIVEPAGRERERWLFSGAAVGRIQTVLRLQRDLELNLPGAALVIELLEEIESLRRRIER